MEIINFLFPALVKGAKRYAEYENAPEVKSRHWICAGLVELAFLLVVAVGVCLFAKLFPQIVNDLRSLSGSQILYLFLALFATFLVAGIIKLAIYSIRQIVSLVLIDGVLAILLLVLCFCRFA